MPDPKSTKESKSTPKKNTGKAEAPKYEPPRLKKFEKLEKLIVSGE